MFSQINKNDNWSGIFPSILTKKLYLKLDEPFHVLFAQFVELDEIIGESLLVPRQGFLTREVFESACQLQMHIPLIRHESESVHTLLALAAAGWGVAVVQLNANITRTAIPLRQDDKNLCVEISAAWNPHAHLPSAAMDLVDAVDDIVRKKIASAL